MWLYIGCGLGAFAGLTLFWVCSNRFRGGSVNRVSPSSRGGSKKKKDYAYEKAPRYRDDDSEDPEPIKEGEQSMMMASFRDGEEGDEEFNTNNDQKTLPRKVPF